jgi:hypothetical protein
MTKLQRTCLKLQPDKSGGSPRAMPQGAFCIMQQVATRKKTTRKKSRKTIKPKPAIVPGAIYNRYEAADVTGFHWMTLFRAYDNGYLKGYHGGSRVTHSGQHLLDWLEAGGKTGRTAEDVTREQAKNNLAD